jgi:hypothetical protein
VERRDRWTHLHVCVDERSAAVSGRLNDEHVVQRPNVVSTAALPEHGVDPSTLDARERSEGKSPSALEDRDVHSGLGEAASGNCAAEPAADHDRSVGVFAEAVHGLDSVPNVPCSRAHIEVSTNPPDGCAADSLEPESPTGT